MTAFSLFKIFQLKPMLFWKRFSVRPSQWGYLYRKNQLQRRLEPGIYRYWDFWSELELVSIPRISKILTVVNQEVITQDNIALRFSYYIKYRIVDGERFLAQIDSRQNSVTPIQEAEQLVHTLSQGYWRSAIAQIDSQALNERRNEILNQVPNDLNRQLGDYGMTVEVLALRDLSFPKGIQDLFARQLEAKVRAKTDLENAKTAVATARALKNAAQLMAEDENIKFLQYLETLTRIAHSGKHTFVIGNPGAVDLS